MNVKCIHTLWLTKELTLNYLKARYVQFLVVSSTLTQYKKREKGKRLSSERREKGIKDEMREGRKGDSIPYWLEAWLVVENKSMSKSGSCTWVPGPHFPHLSNGYNIIHFANESL